MGSNTRCMFLQIERNSEKKPFLLLQLKISPFLLTGCSILLVTLIILVNLRPVTATCITEILYGGLDVFRRPFWFTSPKWIRLLTKCWKQHFFKPPQWDMDTHPHTKSVRLLPSVSLSIHVRNFGGGTRKGRRPSFYYWWPLKSWCYNNNNGDFWSLWKPPPILKPPHQTTCAISSPLLCPVRCSNNKATHILIMSHTEQASESIICPIRLLFFFPV